MLVTPHVKTVLAWIAFTNKSDVKNMRKIISPNILDQIRPLSLNIPDTTFQSYLDRLAVNTIKFGILDPKPENIMESGNKVAIWTTSNGTTEHGFPWINEYVIRFTFEGNKISHIFEMQDPNVATPALEKEAAVAEALINCGNQ